MNTGVTSISSKPISIKITYRYSHIKSTPASLAAAISSFHEAFGLSFLIGSNLFCMILQHSITAL